MAAPVSAQPHAGFLRLPDGLYTHTQAEAMIAEINVCLLPCTCWQDGILPFLLPPLSVMVLVLAGHRKGASLGSQGLGEEECQCCP